MALNFNQFAAEANTFLKEYTKKLNVDGDTDRASRILSSVLHGLREVISFEESLQLIAQFPMFLKAVYVNQWSATQKRRVKNTKDFIDRIKQLNGTTYIYDFESYDIAENHIVTTFYALRKYVSLGELEDIRSELPKDLKTLIYDNMMF